jgi:hypothetical protein
LQRERERRLVIAEVGEADVGAEGVAEGEAVERAQVQGYLINASMSDTELGAILAAGDVRVVDAPSPHAVPP